MTDFDLALAFVLEQEGGTSDHPADRGGLTHYGISRAAFGKRYPDFFEAPSIEKATTIYRRHFWQQHRCELLGWPLSLVYFDMVVNHRPSDAARVLQRGLRVKVDGKVGKVTRRTAREKGVTAVVSILGHRAELYRKIVTKRPSQAVFFRGWMNRTITLAVHVNVDAER